MSIKQSPFEASPHLTKWLDSSAMTSVLAESVRWPDGGHPVDVALHRFTPRGDGSVDIEYVVRCEVEGQSDYEVTVFARSPRLDSTCLRVSRRGRSVAGQLTGVFVDIEGMDLTIHSADCDESLPRFRDCLEASYIANRVNALALRSRESWKTINTDQLRSSVVSFRRGRRFVVRLDEYSPEGLGRSWALKCFADTRSAQKLLRHELIASRLKSRSGDELRVPRVVGHDAELNAVVTEWEIGHSARPLEPEHVEFAGRAGESLAIFHQISPDGFRPVRDDRYWSTITRWAEIVRHAYPELHSQAESSLSLLEAARALIALNAPVLVHGDFYESQVVIFPEHATILDLDTAAVGRRELDIGNLLAHQCLYSLQHDCSSERFAAQANVMLSAYTSVVDTIDDRALRYYWAATLFRIGALHLFRTNTRIYAGALWRWIEPVLRFGRDALWRHESGDERGGSGVFIVRSFKEAAE